MDKKEIFQELKKQILETYKSYYPFFQGNWKNFSSKDISQLIDLVENNLNERVSEKWIYTHLKPEQNEKLPRKDMLDIFSRFVDFSGWNEFSYQFQQQKIPDKQIKKPETNSSKHNILKFSIGIVILVLTGFGIYFFYKKNVKTKKKLEIQNEFTNEPISTDEIKAYKVSENEKVLIPIENSKIEVENEDEKILIESPFFEKKEVKISESQEKISLKPEDYAMVLKNYIHSDLKDWEDRKEKLNKIFSEDLEVIILLNENLGAEYLNKKEFSEKLIIPTSSTKKMKILDLETNEQKQITFIRIQQL